MSNDKPLNIYRCELNTLLLYGGKWRLSVKMLEDHKHLGGRTGEMTTTSEVKFIDFERGYAITRNSMYIWSV